MSAENSLSSNFKSVQNLIKQRTLLSGRSTGDVRLIAVSKTRSLAEVEIAIKSGQKYFAENTIQDALTKIPELSNDALEWHFIGHLQSKKANKIPGHFQWVHTIDSMKLADKLSSAMLVSGAEKNLNCLIQVNIADETSKSGIQPEELFSFVELMLEHNHPALSWRGLMTIGCHGDAAATRMIFRELKQLRDDVQQRFGLKEFDQLSMGMSGDYEIAIEEGSTMVRVGTAIFGQRI